MRFLSSLICRSYRWFEAILHSRYDRQTCPLLVLRTRSVKVAGY